MYRNDEKEAQAAWCGASYKAWLEETKKLGLDEFTAVMEIGSPYFLAHHFSVTDKRKIQKVINKPTSTSENNNKPLHMSAYMQDPKITQLLIDNKAELNVFNDLGQTPLHIAASFGDEGIVEVLLKNGALLDVLDKNTTREPSPLSRAVKGGFEGIVKMLIEGRADVNRMHKGLTPLHLAVENGNLPIVELLVKAKANINVDSYQGSSLLGIAIKNGQGEIAKYLEKALMKVSSSKDSDLEPPNKKRKTSTMPRSSDSANDGAASPSASDSHSAPNSSDIEPSTKVHSASSST